MPPQPAPAAAPPEHSLLDVLVDCQLQHYLYNLAQDLHVCNVRQLLQVTDDQLCTIGMSEPETVRLRRVLSRLGSATPLTRLRRRLSLGGDHSVSHPHKVYLSQADVSVRDLIGEGEFATVNQGVLNISTERALVAVKSLRLLSSVSDFMRDVTPLLSIRHPHLLTYYGVVVDVEKPPCLVIELAPLRSLLDVLTDPLFRSTFTVLKLACFAHQICSAMAELERLRIIHYNLALRNVMLSSADSCKVGDYGLVRPLGVLNSQKLKLPVAWCAPEVANQLHFSSFSDVWAYGVTLWELFSYGGQPWQGTSAQQIISAVCEGQQPPRPAACPADHYSLMRTCWALTPRDRPSFHTMNITLRQLRPDLVQAITNSPARPPSDACISFEKGDVLTVLDKQCRVDGVKELCWRGVTKAGQVGLFHPADVVYYTPAVGEMYSSTASLSKSKRKPLTRTQIGLPESDLRHIGHVGYDGSMFGDVAFIGPTVEKLPFRVTELAVSPRGMSQSPVPTPKLAHSAATLPPAGLRRTAESAARNVAAPRVAAKPALSPISAGPLDTLDMSLDVSFVDEIFSRHAVSPRVRAASAAPSRMDIFNVESTIGKQRAETTIPPRSDTTNNNHDIAAATINGSATFIRTVETQGETTVHPSSPAHHRIKPAADAVEPPPVVGNPPESPSPTAHLDEEATPTKSTFARRPVGGRPNSRPPVAPASRPPAPAVSRPQQNPPSAPAVSRLAGVKPAPPAKLIAPSPDAVPLAAEDLSESVPQKTSPGNQWETGLLTPPASDASDTPRDQADISGDSSQEDGPAEEVAPAQQRTSVALMRKRWLEQQSSTPPTAGSSRSNSSCSNGPTSNHTSNCSELTVISRVAPRTTPPAAPTFRPPAAPETPLVTPDITRTTPDVTRRAPETPRVTPPRTAPPAAPTAAVDISKMVELCGHPVSQADAEKAMSAVRGNTQSAVKYLKLQYVVQHRLADIERCKDALVAADWSVHDAIKLLHS